MTNPTIGAVVRCSDLITGVYATVASLRGSSTPVRSIALVADPSTPRSADAWLGAFASVRGVHMLRMDTPAPGAVWNAGLSAVGPVDLAVCIESGDTLEQQALESMSRRMVSDPTLAIVTCGTEWVGPNSRRTFTVPSACTPLDLLADPLAVHISSLFRWSQWRATTGFDEEMPDLEYADFWLKLMRHYGTVAVEMSPLLRRFVHARALHRRTWRTSDYRRAVEALFEHYREELAARPSALLEAAERGVVREYVRHQTLITRNEDAHREIESLTKRRDDVLTPVPKDWKPSFDFGELARTAPLSHDWGYDRGAPADRPFIERYLASHAEDIHGAVLEIQENDYTRMFGGDRVTRADVLDLDATNPRATLIGDLRAIDHLAPDTYDAIILTQTLHVVDDMRAVVRECARLLKPGGTLLATLPSASRVCLEYGPEGDFWRVTDAGARRLFADVFPPSSVETASLGNPLVNAAFGFGLASEDLPAGAYENHDPFFPMVIGVRARKPQRTNDGSSLVRCGSGTRSLTLMYHRVGAPGEGPHYLSVSDAAFRAQLDWLGNTCSLVPLADLADGTLSSRPDRAVALTFDDGYLDNLLIALPLLQTAGAPATFFLTTGDGSFPYHYWWDRLATALTGGTPVPPMLKIDLPSGRQDIATSTDQERLAAHWLIYHELVRLPHSDRNALLDEILTWATAAGPNAGDRRMTWDEVRKLASDPRYSVGAHTVEHLYLPAQPDDVLTAELVDSRTTLESRTGLRIEALAYPYGAVDGRTVAAARDAGFKLAVTCAEGAIMPSSDPLALPRVAVMDEPLDRFIARVERTWGV